VKAKCVWVDFLENVVRYDISVKNKVRTVLVPRNEARRLAEWHMAIEKRAGHIRGHAFGYYWISEEAWCIR